MKDEQVDLLVIAAHPDDAEISVGGTLLVAKSLGYRIGVLDLSYGELSSRGNPEVRLQETATATRALELDYRGNLDLGDGAIRDHAAGREALARVVRRLKPITVLTPWYQDLHPDHAGAGDLTRRTWYMLGVGKFAAGEPPYRPPLLGYYMLHTPFHANAIVNVSHVWEKKLASIRAFQSQFFQEGSADPKTKISQPHFMAAIEGRAREYGLQAGCEFGEPICWDWPVKLQDPVRWRCDLERSL